jgi:hypothetical protein
MASMEGRGLSLYFYHLLNIEKRNGKLHTNGEESFKLCNEVMAQLEPLRR